MSDLPSPTSAPPVVVSASIAFDYIMAFGGSFADHIIPEKTHVISVSFLVDSLKKQRGGIGGNISYSLALLGTRSTLVGAVGSDFGPYRAAFEELGVDLTYVVDEPNQLTAAAFMMADRKDNQIASFFPGPSERAADVSLVEVGRRARYGIVGATAPSAMQRHARDLAASGCRLIYDPAFQIIILTADELREGINLAWAIVANDYEYAMLERKTGLTLDDLEARLELLVVTFGDAGSEWRRGGRRVRVPAAPATVVRDPTGAGDAFRAGMIKGLLLDRDLDVVGRIAGLAATYAVEHVGTQEHVYTPEAFVARFDDAFPNYRGAITTDDLMPAEPALAAAR